MSMTLVMVGCSPLVPARCAACLFQALDERLACNFPKPGSV